MLTFDHEEKNSQVSIYLSMKECVNEPTLKLDRE